MQVLTPNSSLSSDELAGNGPSGITLSFLLSGHWPYYSGAPLSDEYLQMRLESCQKDLSIVDQDLEFLSDGLEGRSSNPVALLFDALTHPDADMGMENDSVLQWRHRKDRVIPHVVLGKSAEGGIWQVNIVLLALFLVGHLLHAIDCIILGNKWALCYVTLHSGDCPLLMQ